MKVEIVRNFQKLSALKLTAKEDMRELGLLLRERIVRRTRQGQGPNGAFAPLSDGYAKQKASALGHSDPDLTVSGGMLNDLQIVAVEDDSVTLGWNK